ncbi:Neutrophil Cytosol Factor 2 [Manis pentadactyla]|nr:Neutrophil Cytosol Factor 2 [Manis pentadactyla]
MSTSLHPYQTVSVWGHSISWAAFHRSAEHLEAPPHAHPQAAGKTEEASRSDLPGSLSHHAPACPVLCSGVEDSGLVPVLEQGRQAGRQVLTSHGSARTEKTVVTNTKSLGG